MNKIKTFIENNSIVIIVGLTILFTLSTCTNKGAIKDIRKSNQKELQEVKESLEVLSDKINEVPTRTDFKIDNEILMYEFLQFEDDLDKGKISLSELKLKLESLRKNNE